MAAGIYAVRCGGKVFVGQSPNLASVENRLRFTLAHGTHPNRALQSAWVVSGGTRLRIEIVETWRRRRMPICAAGRSRSGRPTGWRR